MDLKFKQKFSQNGSEILRRCGYGKIYDKRSDQTSYTRRLGREHYPRFHCYINSEDPLILSLHIDQKRVSYEGQTAHSGDYTSDLVKQELIRIAKTIESMNK